MVHIQSPGLNAGTLCLPDSTENLPAVVLLHGFASHQDEVGGAFAMLAERLAQRQIASYRFTFRNFDLPENALVRTTLDDMVAEAEATCNTLASVPQIDPNRIGLLGFSLGGAVAILAAARNPSGIKALATWSCAANLETTFRSLVGEARFEQALGGDDLSLDLGWREIRLSASFFKSLSGGRPLDRIRSYSNPFLAIAGSEDPLSAYLDPYYRNAPGAAREKMLIDGADHIFNILEAPDRFAPRVIEKTSAWFRENL